MAQRSTPDMVPLSDFGKTRELPREPVNWQRRIFIGAGLAIVSGGLIGALAWVQQRAGTHVTGNELGQAGAGKRGTLGGR